jgi:hypothetical protein
MTSVRPAQRLPRPTGAFAAVAARVDGWAVAVLALPWLALAADPLWVYSGLARDAWAYWGLMQDLPGGLAAFRDHYSAGRLSALLPGAAVYSLLSPVAANLVLHVGVHTVAVLSGYAAVAAVAGRRAAFLAAVALGTNPFFLRAAGWDYVDGYVIAYFLLATALAARAGRPGRHWRVWCAAAGAAGGCAVVGYLSAALLLPGIAALFLVTNRGGGRHPAEAAGFWAIVGFFAAFALFAAASKLLGGPVVFFLPSLVYAGRTFGPEAAAQFIFPPHEWASRAAWLVLPAAAAVGAVVFLVRWASRRGESNPAAAVLQLQLLGLAGILVVTQVRGEFGALQVWLAASWALLAPAVLSVGGQLGRWADALSADQFRLVAAGWVAVFTLAAVPPDRLGFPAWAAAVPLGVALAAAMLGLVAVQVFPARATVGFTVAVLLAGAGAVARDHFRIANSVCNPEARVRFDRCQAFDPRRAECFRTIAEANAFARSLAPAGKVWFWYNLDDPLGPVYDTAAHTDFHYLQVVNLRFPDLADGKVWRGDPVQTIARAGGGAVVVLSDRPDAADRALYWLRGCGMTAHAEPERVVGRPPMALRAVVIRVAAGG